MFQKLHLKELFKNTAAATHYLNGNKMTYKITSAGKLTSKGKKRR